MALGKYRCSLKVSQMPCTPTALHGQCYGKCTVHFTPAIPRRSAALGVCVGGGGGGEVGACLQMTGALLNVLILPFGYCSVESTSPSDPCPLRS